MLVEAVTVALMYAVTVTSAAAFMLVEMSMGVAEVTPVPVTTVAAPMWEAR